MDADCLGGEEPLLRFLNGLHPQTQTFLLAIMLCRQRLIIVPLLKYLLMLT